MKPVFSDLMPRGKGKKMWNLQTAIGCTGKIWQKMPNAAIKINLCLQFVIYKERTVGELELQDQGDLLQSRM